MYYLFLFSFLIITPASHANVHLEPYVGIGGANSSLDNSTPISLVYNVGARVGYKVLNITAGLDMFFNFYKSPSSFAFPSVVVRNPRTTTGFTQAGESLAIFYSEKEEPIQPFSIGAFGIFQVPLVIDIYGTAFYSFTGSKYHGPGLKAGASLPLSFFLNLNLELQWTYYLCKESNCKTPNINALALLLSLSAPFSLNLFDRSTEQDQQRYPESIDQPQYPEQHSDEIQSLTSE